MDINPLYELRARLKNALISGTDLIAEDFRLKRAAEAMKPLEAVSPVFAKIGQLMAALLADGCEDRPGMLLDALTLVDAVICTQGTVAVPGEIEEIKSPEWGSAVTNAPYSVLHTLLDALANSGNGRYSYVVDTHTEHPELFEDYRIKHALVKALGASYAELAEQAAAWLSESGEAVVPLLKSGFDPKGKREMVRRVSLIETICGSRENDFYREMLPQAEKDVKGALIYALRHTEDNAELLIELTKTERGSSKKMALWALAAMEHGEAKRFWEEYTEKKPEEALTYLVESQAGWACRLTAISFKKLLEPWAGAASDQELPQKTAAQLTACLIAMPGKTGSDICECYRIAADIKDRLERPVAGDKNNWAIAGLPGGQAYARISFQDAVPQILQYSLCVEPDQELGDLAVRLYEAHGKRYFAAAFTARLLFASEEEFREWTEREIYKRTLTGKTLKKEMTAELVRVLGSVIWDEKQGKYILIVRKSSPADGQIRTLKHVLPWSADGYLTELAMNISYHTLDAVLGMWIQPDNEAYCQRLGGYFYKRARTETDNRMYLSLLAKCRWSECAGLAVKFFGGKVRSAWEVRYYLSQMPGDAAARLKETEAVYELAKQGKLKGVKLVESLEEYMEELKTERAAEGLS
ncbi:MAG: hypothetical protein HFG14_10310 [Lachnospiraceae bacterium]|jgi:hypothetical protein|nr:hypothetical protein [Lachnospiraceae bacterium]